MGWMTKQMNDCSSHIKVGSAADKILHQSHWSIPYLTVLLFFTLGIVYDVTEFVHEHPGGHDLVQTAAGMDLEHYFANYTVHGDTDKAARWLAGCAIGRLSDADAHRAAELSTSEAHVQKRHQILQQKRKTILYVAVSLPFWMTIRSVVRFIGAIVPSLGTWLARSLPITVPGITPGTEPLAIPSGSDPTDTTPSVAVIGGGIAGCGAAWTLARSGFRVVLLEARSQISGNARTFEWDFSPYRKHDTTVKSCVSVTAWPPLFYKNYTCLLDMLGIETVHMPLVSWGKP
jgi:hypothetical protein